MRRTLLVVLASAVFGLVACSKADSSKHTGSSPPVNDPGSRGAVTGGPPGGVVGGPKGALTEGAVAADNGPADNAPADNAPDHEFELVTSESAGIARVVVTPGKGFHMNKEYPTKLTLQLPEGVSSPKAVLEPADAEAFTENQLAFAVRLTAAGKGAYTIPATIKFAVCTDSTCNPKKRSIALSLKAQ